jgi:hypothetical protein
MELDRQSKVRKKLESVTDNRHVKDALLELFFYEVDEGNPAQYTKQYQAVLEKHSKAQRDE